METPAQAGHSGILDFRFTIVEYYIERLDQAIVSYVSTEGFCELGEVPSEAESDLPRSIFSCIENGSKRVHPILFFAQISCHRYKGLNAEDAT